MLAYKAISAWDGQFNQLVMAHPAAASLPEDFQNIAHPQLYFRIEIYDAGHGLPLVSPPVFIILCARREPFTTGRR
jgi:hypothetical protein